MTEPTIPAILPQTTETADENAVLIRLHEKMVKSIRSWGTWLLVMGAIQLIASQLFEPTFGVVILIVGALSFVFTHPAVFVLYATTLAWAAINNLLGVVGGGQAMWGGFALVQLYIAYSTLREYALYRRNEPAYRAMLRAEGAAATKERTPDPVFPIGGCALSLLGVVLMVGLFILLLVLAAAKISPSQSLLSWTIGLAEGCAVLSVGLSAASLASKFRHRLLSMFALAGAGLTVLVFIVLMLG